MVGFGVVFQDPEDIADVYADCFAVVRVEVGVRAEGLFVAVKCQSDKFSFSVEDRASRVSTCDVVVRQEVYREGAAVKI